MAKPRFKYRPNTDDLGNFMSIVLHNEYVLPSRLDPEGAVIDVGAHVGSFAIAAYARGARNVWCFEPERSNFIALAENVANLAPHVRAYNLAVWRSDVAINSLRYVPSEVLERTGGGHVFGGETATQEVEAVRFDSIVDMASSGVRRIALVKLDCEGSEWPILLSSGRLDLVDAIVGEFHEIGGPNMDKITTQQSHPRSIPPAAQVDGYEAYTVDVLGKFLSDRGFSVEAVPTPGHEWIGKFWATRGRPRWRSS